MWRIREKLARFMAGRYGIDKLYYGLFGLSIVLMVVNMVVQSAILSILIWMIIFVSFFRVFSRNIYKRANENTRFLKGWNAVKTWFKITKRRIKEFRTKVFFKCPHCKAVVRLSRKKGKHTVNCPKCRRDFKVKVWWPAKKTKK